MNQTVNTIVLIHGLWMTPRSWDLFREFYQMRGYQVFAPAWPRLLDDVEANRRNPSALAWFSDARANYIREQGKLGVIRLLLIPFKLIQSLITAPYKI